MNWHYFDFQIKELTNTTVKRFIHVRTSEEMDGAIHESAFLKIRNKALTLRMDGRGWYSSMDHIIISFRTLEL